MKPETFKKDELLIEYGDQGSTYFILSKGNVMVIVYEKGTDPSDPLLAQKIVFTKILSQGCGFGELALLYNDKRSASIMAMGDCETYTLDGITFKTIVIRASMERREKMSKFLNAIPIFGKYDFYLLTF